MLDIIENRTFVDIILSAEVIFCVVLTLSLFIAVHALLGLMRQSGALYTRLAQIEAELSVLHASIPGKLERITALRQSLQPLQADFRLIQTYYARLQHMDRLWIEQQAERERAELEDKDKKIQRQKLGLDRLL